MESGECFVSHGMCLYTMDKGIGDVEFSDLATHFVA